MALALHADPLPLHLDSSETVRVGNSRVTLETLIERFHCGDTPEMLAESFTTVSLADIYSVIGYYLRHRAEIDAYLSQQARQAEDLRARHPEVFADTQAVRDRLQARLAKGSADNDSVPRG